MSFQDPKQPKLLPRYPEVFKRISDLFYFFREMKIVPIFFFLAAVCSFISMFFNFFGLKLFIPLLKGLIQGDFSSVGDKVGVIRFLAGRFPGVFGNSHMFFIALIGIIFLSILLKNALDYFSALSVGQQIRRADANIRQLIVSRYLSFGKLYYDRARLSEVVNTMMNAAGGVTGQLEPLQKLISQILSLAAYLAVLFWISWKLTIFVLLVYPFFDFSTRWLVRRVQNSARAHEFARLGMLERLTNVVSCIPLVKAYANEEAEKQNLSQTSEEEIKLAYETQKVEQLIAPIQDISTMAFLLSIVGAMFVIKPTGSVEGFSSYLVFFYVVRIAMKNFNVFSNFQMSLARADLQISQVEDILLNPEGKFFVRDGSAEFQGLNEGIEIRGLHFSYREKRPVLNDLSFSMKKGQMTAIVGPTGAGKTTLVHLLMRFYDCPAGTIFVDGSDIRDFRISSWLGRVAFVGQDPMLFHDTLRANLVYGLNRPVSDQELTDAVRKAKLESMVSRLPEGLDTVIGDRGSTFSGGEKQRVSIARAFLKDAEILILDEATSALDTKTERSIQQALDEMGGKQTLIVIAHRLSTVIHADNVLVIEGGQVVEQGILEGLLQKKGKFYEYWEAQKHRSGNFLEGSVVAHSITAD